MLGWRSKGIGVPVLKSLPCRKMCFIQRMHLAKKITTMHFFDFIIKIKIKKLYLFSCPLVVWGREETGVNTEDCEQDPG